jgi:predicted acylesterase/phospholipase RssA
MPAFRIGINMAGAISAGAYTAGVLDFLIEALDAWYAARGRGELVPMHDVSIEVFSGASAGGMCAAISAVMVHEDFEHIHDTSRRGTTNRLYESWVNRIDIRELLKTRDLAPGKPVVSLLDSTVIAEIAKDALTPGAVKTPARPFIAGNLTLFLSLTNLRGVPYSLNGAAPGSIEETTFYYADRMRFEMVPANASAASVPGAKPLPVGTAGGGSWTLLQTAAMATGAFPIFLAPRVLERDVGDYTPPMWEPMLSTPRGTRAPIEPNFPDGLTLPFATLNVDGGVTNNDPFRYAHDYLAAGRGASEESGGLPSDPMEAESAVVTVAPFPTQDEFDAHFDCERSSGIFSVIGGLFNALVTQSRFFGESLAEIMTGATFSRFVIAPTDDTFRAKDRAAVPPQALQCAALGAFGGFFDRAFRAHDYALGRRNCQQFLRRHFVLPEGNPIIAEALEKLSAEERAEVMRKFCQPAPKLAPGEFRVPEGSAWLPVIPLCTSGVSEEAKLPARAAMSRAALSEVTRLIGQRFRALLPSMVGGLPNPLLRLFLRLGKWPVWLMARGWLERYLRAELGSAVKE